MIVLFNKGNIGQLFVNSTIFYGVFAKTSSKPKTNTLRQKAICQSRYLTRDD